MKANNKLIIKCCIDCKYSYRRHTDKGFKRRPIISLRCEKLKFVEVDEHKIHPDCPLKDCEVIEQKEVKYDDRYYLTFDSNIELEDIDKVVIIKKGNIK